MIDLFIKNMQHFLHKALIDGLESCGLLVDYYVLSAVWTLILTGPINYRESIGEQVL